MNKINKNPLSLEERIQKINSILKGCQHISFFGGAGVSTASGIPDFRSPKGLYRDPDPEFKDYEPEYLLSTECLQIEPELFYRFYRKLMDMRGCKPNIIHLKLAALEADGKMMGIITQNIDTLHEDAGSGNIAKIHGTASACYCAKCGRKYKPEKILDSTETIPECKCGGLIRPNVVLYGELLPEKEMQKANAILEHSDCLIICGTSCVLPHIQNMIRSYTGTWLIVLNGTETPFDSYADVTCHEDIFDIWNKIEWT